MTTTTFTFTLDHPTNRPNYTVVTLNDLTIAFSYRTPIALHHPDHGFVRRPNDWGPTTGRHFNEFSRTANEVPADEFLTLLASLL